ncbi:hypothetical protein GCM10010442_81890 [Kitasatospora kifunensis]
MLGSSSTTSRKASPGVRPTGAEFAPPSWVSGAEPGGAIEGAIELGTAPVVTVPVVITGSASRVLGLSADQMMVPGGYAR